MLNILGLDKLERQLKDAQKALEALHGELASVSFDANDPTSIEKAMTAVDQMLNDQVGRYAGNPIIGPLADGMKQQYREAILEKAAAARLEGDQGE